MAIYFVGEYPDYYEKLKSKSLIKLQQETMSTGMDEVNSEINGLSGLLTELEGNYKSEMVNTFNALINEVMVSYNCITNDLKKNVDTLEELSGNLGTFKEKDEDLEKNDRSLKSEENRSVVQYETDENDKNVETKEYKDKQNKVNELKEVIEDIKSVIFEYRDKSDMNIKSIEDFNNSIVNIRLKMAAVSFAQDGLTLDEIRNLSVEEREELIQKMIDAMTAKYNEYKELYEAYSNVIFDVAIKDPAFHALNNIYCAIMGKTAGIIEVQDDMLASALNYVDYIKKIEGLKTKDGKSLIDCLKSYYETGDFVGSGLGELYRTHKHFGMMDATSIENSFKNGEAEKWFWQEVLNDALRNHYNDNPLSPFADNPKVVVGDVLMVYTGDNDEDGISLKQLADQFEYNYLKTVEVGTSIHGLKELKGHIKYDVVYMSPDYKNFQANCKPFGEFINDLSSSTSLDGRLEVQFIRGATQYMTPSELDMFRYLYETQGKEAAFAFRSSIDVSLTKREGVYRGTNYYYDLVEGDNSGLEVVEDILSIGVTGIGDGAREFCDGLVDLVAPSKELSADEYAQLTLLACLTEGGSSYDSTLLTSYSIGSGLGKEALPLVLNLVVPGSGKYVKMASETGNALEAYFRADDSTTYWEAFAHAGLDLLTTDGIDTIASAYGLNSTPLGQLGVAAAKNVANTAVGYAFNPDDYEGENIFAVLTNCMQGQLSDGLQDIGTDMLNDYLENLGWPEAWAEATTDLFEPAISTVVDAGLDGVKEAGKALGDNIETGSYKDIFQVGSDAVIDSMDVEKMYQDIGENMFDKGKKDAKAAAEKAVDNYFDVDGPLK